MRTQASAIPDNFASFDSNGGLQDSNCNEGTFIKGVKKGTETLTPVDGVVTIPSDIEGAQATSVPSSQSATATIDSNHVLQLGIPRGADAVNPFKGYFDSLSNLQAKYPTGETGDFANVYDSTADKTYRYIWDASLSTPAWTQALDSSSQPIEVTPSTATFATGQSVIDTSIVNDLTTGGTEDVLSAEQGKVIAETTMELVESENLLNPNDIDTTHRINRLGEVKTIGTSTAVYGCTDYIPIGDEGLTANHCVAVSGTSYCSACVYDVNHLYISYADVSHNGYAGYISKNMSYPGTPVEGADTENPYYVRFNFYNPASVEGGVAYDGVTDGYAIYKGNQVDKQFIPYFTPYWDQKEANIKDNAITTQKIADDAVTIDKMADTEVNPVTDNICNPEECVFDGTYIYGTNGNVGPSNSNYAGHTGYIPIDEQGVYFSASKSTGTVIGYAYYSDKNTQSYITGYYQGNTPEGCTMAYAAYVEDAKYVRFSIASGYTAETVMANKGNNAKPYVEYAGFKKVISQEILPQFSNDDKTNYEDGVSIVLPSNIYCTKGDTLYLYWRSFIETVNPKVFDCCSPNSTTTNNVLSYPDCLKITRTSDTPFNVVVRDNALNEIAKKTVNFKAVDVPTSPASAINVLLVGASREANGVTPLEVYRRLVGDSTMSPAGLGLININFVGREGCKAYDCEQLGYQSSLYSQVKHEAVSGKKIHDMVVAGDLTGYTFYFEPNEGYIFNQGDKYTDGTRVYTVVGSDPAAGDLQVSISSGSGTPSATGTLTLTEGSGTASVDYTSYENETSNPFWNSSTGKIDFAKYSTDYCNGATINILVLCRVMNDIWNGRTPIQVVADYQTVIDGFHEYNSNGYVIINLGVLSSMYGGLPHSYTKGLPLNTAWYAARTILETHKLLIELGESDDYKDFCLLSNSNAEFDLDYFYSKEAVTIRNRGISKTVNYDNNGLHFNETGKQVVADSIYHCVCKIINDING